MEQIPQDERNEDRGDQTAEWMATQQIYQEELELGAQVEVLSQVYDEDASGYRAWLSVLSSRNVFPWVGRSFPVVRGVGQWLWISP